MGDKPADEDERLKEQHKLLDDALAEHRHVVKQSRRLSKVLARR